MFGSAHRARRLAKAALSATPLVAPSRRDVHQRLPSGDAAALRAGPAVHEPQQRLHARREGSVRRFLLLLAAVLLAASLLALSRLEAVQVLPMRLLAAAMAPYSARPCADFVATAWWAHALMVLQRLACDKSYSVVYTDGEVQVVDYPGKRFLLFGEQVETEIEVDEQGRYQAPSQYIRMLAAQIRTRFPALAAAAASAPPGSLLLMGVGGGSLFMELLFQNYTRFELVGVDLDEQVLSLRTRYFDALLEPLRTPDAKVSFVHADAEQFLGNSSAPAHTVIVNDCYVKVLNDLPPELLTEQFTKRVHSRLIRGGGYYINVLSHYNGSGAEPHVAAAATVRAVFGNVEVYVSDWQALPVVPSYWTYQGSSARRFDSSSSAGTATGGTDTARQVLRHHNALRRMGLGDGLSPRLPHVPQRQQRRPVNRGEHNVVLVGVKQ